MMISPNFVLFLIFLLNSQEFSLCEDKKISNERTISKFLTKAKIKLQRIKTMNEVKLKLEPLKVTENYIQDRKEQSEGCGISEFGVSSCQAWEEKASSRIVGGQEVHQAHKHPWQAYLQICTRGSQCVMCGGALIDDQWVLTAAHCVLDEATGTIRDDITVFFGGEDLMKLSMNEPAYKAVLKIPHPDFHRQNYDNDIALIKVNRAVKMSKAVRSICLPNDVDARETYTGRKVIVTGWGATKYEGDPSSILKETSVKILPHEDQICKNGAVFDHISPSKLCGFGLGTDACQGDSGGPMIVAENGRCTVIGVVSYGYKCAERDRAGIYTKVSHYLPWIRETMERSESGEGTKESCDLTCTNAKSLTGDFQINDIASTCINGICSRIDEGEVSLCQALGNPCGSNEIQKCEESCDFSWAFIEEGYSPVEICGIKVRCDSSNVCCRVSGESTWVGLCFDVLFACLKSTFSS